MVLTDRNYDVTELPRGGGLLSPKPYVDVPARRWKSDFLYTNFLPNFPPISVPFLKEKHPILNTLGAFYNNLPLIHPIYVIWAPSSLMKPPDRYTKFCEKAPQKAGTYTYTMSMWEPPRGIAVSCRIEWTRSVDCVKRTEIFLSVNATPNLDLFQNVSTFKDISMFALRICGKKKPTYQINVDYAL